MANRITITYEEHGVETTYSKALPDDPMLDDVFVAYLEANERFTFQNDVTVNIHNPIIEDSVIEWTKDNGVYEQDSYTMPSETADTINEDIKNFVRDNVNKWDSEDTSIVPPKVYFCGTPNEAQEVSEKIKALFTESQDCTSDCLSKWYMGHHY